MYEVKFVTDFQVVSLKLTKKELEEHFSSKEITEGWVENEVGCYKITKVSGKSSD